MLLKMDDRLFYTGCYNLQFVKQTTKQIHYLQKAHSAESAFGTRYAWYTEVICTNNYTKEIGFESHLLLLDNQVILHL